MSKRLIVGTVLLAALTALAACLPFATTARERRDFYAFEQHVRTCRAQRGLGMVPQWYEVPVFYFSNPHSVIGHGAAVVPPKETRELDFELEI